MIFLLDAGHGGFIDGDYDTEKRYKGGKQAHHTSGEYIYEGEINRALRNKVVYWLKKKGIYNFAYLTDGDEDISLQDRVKAANKYDKAILISIHCNGGGGTGFEIYTTKGETNSDRVADVFIKHCKAQFPSERFRADHTDGDGDKEANFYILKKSKHPAILTENFFMDTLQDCRKLLSFEVQNKIGLYHANAIEELSRKV